MEEARKYQSQSTLILPSPPSAIENSSTSTSHFIVGTYSLVTTEALSAASRSGSLCIVGPSGADSNEYVVCSSYGTASAVLDLSVDATSNSIAVANSTGGVELWQETASSESPSRPVLTHLRTVQTFADSVLVLSLHRHPSSQWRHVFALSLSDGSLAVIDCSQSSPLLWQEPAHELEAWTIRWHPELKYTSGNDISCNFESRRLFSGGDDSAMRITDVLLQSPIGKTSTDSNTGKGPECMSSNQLPSYADRRIHGAGVTAMLSLAYDTSHAYPNKVDQTFQHHVLTGSYDDRIRILRVDDTKTRRLQCLTELDMGGGVWRLSLIGRKYGKNLDNIEDRWWVLASCMYAGCRVLEVRSKRRSAGSEPAWEICVVARFEEHESMNYASAALGDPVVGNEQKHPLEGLKIVSTSFYDRRFCVWELSGFEKEQEAISGDLS